MVYFGSDREGVTTGDPRTRSVYYRRIPGSRGYYNPLTGDTLTEHQYLRRYRRGRTYRATTVRGDTQVMEPPTDEQLALQLEYQADLAYQRRQRRAEIREQYAYANDVTYQEAQADPAFRRLVERRDYLEYEKERIRRTYGTESQEYQDFLAPDSEFAEVLVGLGLRPPDADWMVGMSDQQPGWPAYYFPGRYG